MMALAFTLARRCDPALLAGAVFLLCACSSEERDGTSANVERSELVDMGDVCVAPPSQGRAFTSMRVTVPAALCGCTQLASSSCDLEVVGSELIVHSTLELETPRREGLVCPDGCEPVSTECSPVELPPGQYVIHLGDLSATISLDNGPLLITRSSVSAVDSCD